MKSDSASLLLGAHLSIAGGLHLAFRRGESLGCTALQVFIKNASRWEGKPLGTEEAELFRSAWENGCVGPVLAHDSYLINLAAPEEALWLKSISAFLDEMERCSLLGIRHLVMHPGAHLGRGAQAGIDRIAEALRRIFDEGPENVTVLIENTAGQGSYIGGRFEELSDILEKVPGDRLAVCLDTCHAFAAGYDISTGEGYEAVIHEFDRLIGIGRLAAFHLNDSKKGLGSRVDRHEHIGQGQIGMEGFRALIRDQRFRNVPKILETPKGEDESFDRRNLSVLREMAGEDG